MEFVILAGAIVAGFIAGWRARELHAIRKVDEILKQAESMTDESDNKTERMNLERHGSVIYAYTVEDHSFIAQGSTLEELDKAIQSRFPGRKFLIKESNLQEIGVSSDTI